MNKREGCIISASLGFIITGITFEEFKAYASEILGRKDLCSMDMAGAEFWSSVKKASFVELTELKAEENIYDSVVTKLNEVREMVNRHSKDIRELNNSVSSMKRDERSIFQQVFGDN